MTLAAARTFRKLVATQLSTDFRKACQVVSTSIDQPLNKDNVLIRNKFAGVNATDVNTSAGRYMRKGDKLPLDLGLEGIGDVVDIGSSVGEELRGRSVGYISNGSYGEYVQAPASVCFPLPSCKLEYVPLLISGLTASLAFEAIGGLHPGSSVFVSAAAGGTGHLAVQLARRAGCRVIAACSTSEKEHFLTQLGCDRVVNYKTENLREAIRDFAPRGLDVVYESVGGPMFEACVNHLARRARVIVIGFIDSYHSPGGIDRSNRNATLITKLLLSSSSVHGFFLYHFLGEQSQSRFAELVQLVESGELTVRVETGDSATGQQFCGVESCVDAVEYLYGRTSTGKVVAQIAD